MNPHFRMHGGCCGQRHDNMFVHRHNNCCGQHHDDPRHRRPMNLRDFRHVKSHDLRCSHDHHGCKCAHDHHGGFDHFHRHGVLKHRDCCIPLSFPRRHHCDPRIHLRLGGLTDNLNFHFLRHEGCPVEVDVESGEGKMEKVRGTICAVGSNFVDILQQNKTTVTLLTDRVVKIRWTDKKCAPCDHHDFHVHDHDH